MYLVESAENVYSSNTSYFIWCISAFLFKLCKKFLPFIGLHKFYFVFLFNLAHGQCFFSLQFLIQQMMRLVRQHFSSLNTYNILLFTFSFDFFKNILKMINGVLSANVICKMLKEI